MGMGKPMGIVWVEAPGTGMGCHILDPVKTLTEPGHRFFQINHSTSIQQQ